MPDNYDFALEDVAGQLNRIERRLDNMGQRIAFLEGSLGQRMAFLEGAVFGPERRADVPSRRPVSAEDYSRSTRRFIRICQIMIVIQVLFVILLQFL